MPIRTLIVSAFFSPLNVIASVRVGKLAKYLAREGHAVTVATFDPEEALALVGPSARSVFVDPAAEGIRMAYFPARPTSAWSRLVAGTVLSDRHGRRLHGAIALFTRAGSLLRLYGIHLGCRKTIRGLLRNDPPDVLVSSYGPHVSHWLGLYAKRLRPGLRWVADFRDPVVNIRKPGWTQGFDRWLERTYVARADQIVVVTEPDRTRLVADYGPRFGTAALAARISVITNGFDPEDAGLALQSAEGPDIRPLSADGRLHLVYTGLLYEGLSDATPLFRMLLRMAREGEIPADGYRVHYAGKNFPQLRAQAASVGAEGCLVDHGFLSRPDTLALQSSADLLLIFNWNYRAEQGMLNAKIFEYLLSGRPILAVVTGDLPGSAIASLVRDARSGFAFETSVPSEEPDFARYLKACVDIVRAGGRPRIEPDPSVVARYAWPSLVRRYADLLAARPDRSDA